MMHGLYTAASGMLAQAAQINAIGNNIANANTPGFKQDGVTVKSFGEELLYRFETGKDAVLIGSTTYGAEAAGTYIVLEQGAIERTDRETDLALNGYGFFTLEDDKGQVKLTRNGSFSVDEAGYLVGVNGLRVMGENGPIFVGDSGFTVSSDGSVYVNGMYTDRLMITCPSESGALSKNEDGTFTFAGEKATFEGEVLQGALESSNVDQIAEVGELIKSSRAYQSCGRIVQMIDETLKKSVNEIAQL